MNTHDKYELPPLPAPPKIGFLSYVKHGKKIERYGQDCMRAAIEACRKRRGEVVVTKTPEGEIIAVTRQDDEGTILSVIAEADHKRRGEPVAWQPIETAPKDGGNILLTNGTDVTVGHWYHEEPCIREKRDIDGHYIGQDESDGYDDWVDWFGGIAPTHWMPLPSAPQPAEPVSGEVAAEAVDLLRAYLRLCRSLPRGDGYHLGRIESAIEALKSPQPVEPVKVPSDDDIFSIGEGTAYDYEEGIEGPPQFTFRRSHLRRFARALLARYGHQGEWQDFPK